MKNGFINKKFLTTLLSVSSILCAYGFVKQEYKDLKLENNTIRSSKGGCATLSVTPKTNLSLLDVSFSNDDLSITVDTTKFYAAPDVKKEVRLYIFGLQKGDGVLLKDGELTGTGTQLNQYSIELKGPAGGVVRLSFEGSRKGKNGHFHQWKDFVLDGTKQKLVFECELPADVLGFGLRLDLVTSGVFTFYAPEFKVVDKQIVAKGDDSFNYILNGGAESGGDNIVFQPMKWRKIPDFDAYVDHMGRKVNFDIELERDSKIFRSGKYSWRVRYVGSAETLASIGECFSFNMVPYEPGKPITLTAWVKAERPVSVELALNNGYASTVGKSFKVSTEWQKLQLYVPEWGKPGEDFKINGNILTGFTTPSKLTVPMVVATTFNTNIWIDDVSVTLGAPKDIRDNRTLYFRECKLDKPHQYYLPGEKPEVSLSFENTGRNELNAVLTYDIIDFFGKSVTSRMVKKLTLKPNVEMRETVAITPPESLRGPFTLAFKLTGDKVSAERSFYAGIVESPGHPNRRLSFNVGAGENVPELIKYFTTFEIGGVRLWNIYKDRPNLVLGSRTAELFHKAGVEVMVNYSTPYDKLPRFFEEFHKDIQKNGKFIDIAETQNEANLTGNVQINADMCNGMRKIIDEVAPHIKLAGGVPCGTDLTWISSVFNAVGPGVLDIVTEHPYRNHPELPDYGDDCAALRKIADRYKPNMPHYATESGRVQPMMAENNRVSEYIRISTARDIRNMLLAFGNGAQSYSQFSLGSMMVGTSWQSLFAGYPENGGAQLPAPILYAMRNIADRLGDGKTLGRIPLGHKYRAYMFDRGDKRVAVLWKFLEDPALLKLKNAGNVEIFDMVGGRLNPTETVMVGECPVYLESSLPADKLTELLKGAELYEKGGNSFAQELQIIDAKIFAVKVQNLSSKALKNVKVVIEKNTDCTGTIQTVKEIDINKDVAVKCGLNTAISTKSIPIKGFVECNGVKSDFALDLRAIMVPKTPKAIVIDGDLTDWPTSTKEIVLTEKNAVKYGPWPPEMLKSTACLRYAWDADNLYIAITVNNKEFNPKPEKVNPKEFFNYDSLQIWFDTVRNSKPEDIGIGDDDFEYLAGLTGGQPKVFLRQGSSASYDSLAKNIGFVDNVKMAVKNYPGKTVYEMAFYRMSISPFRLRAGNAMRSSVIINLRENDKRIGYFELAPGCGAFNRPGQWMDLVLLP